MSSLLDQSPLLDLAERLVDAARRAGADAADAVAVRSISLSVEVRDGAVEESERAEGDDMGLRVLVGKRQAVVSTNDVKGNGADALAERAVAMARVAPEDQFAGLADASLLAHEFPDLDLIDPRAARRRARWKQHARAAESAGARREGRQQVRRRQRVGRHRRHGAGDEPRLSRRLCGLAPLDVDGGDRRRRHRHGARLRFLLGAACRRPRSAGEDRHASRASARSSGSIRARSRRGACRSCSIRASRARWSGILASAINGASIARKTSFLKDRMGERLFRSGIRIVDDPLRRRGLRSRPFDGEGVAGKPLAVIEDGVLKSWFLDSRDRARTVACDHRPRGARRFLVALPVADQPASRSRHADARRS